jgi:hypothetical protein
MGNIQDELIEHKFSSKQYWVYNGYFENYK